MTTRPTNSVSQHGQLAEVITAYFQAVEAGETPDRKAILEAHPDLAAELAGFFADEVQFDRLLSPFRGVGPTPTTWFQAHHPRLWPRRRDRLRVASGIMN